MKCPVCEKGTLKPTQEKHVMYGVDLGTYPAQKCTACGEVFTDGDAMEKIEAMAKKKGVWGLGRKSTITKSGNSLSIRIPKEIVKYLEVREGHGVYLHPEKDKLIVDLDKK
jgi:YgiT-type zinc finger domain-containing protein